MIGPVPLISTEHVTGTIPFAIRRRVKWGECDPAGVVFTVSGSKPASASRRRRGRSNSISAARSVRRTSST